MGGYDISAGEWRIGRDGSLTVKSQWLANGNTSKEALARQKFHDHERKVRV
jgi:hypothetical protein